MSTLSPKAQAAVNHIVERFRAGDLAPLSAVAKLQLPHGHPASAWSFNNKVLAWAQADTLDCRGYEAWKGVGRHVKPGGQGIFIFRPILVKRVDETTGNVKPCLIGFAPIPVFPADQTDGDPTGLAACQPKQLPPLTSLAVRLGIEVRYQPTPSDRLGDCDLAGNRINLGSHAARTFYHELAHAIHARLVGGLRGGQQADQETSAEFIACVLAELYGVQDITGDSWSYIASYNADPLKAIEGAMKTVEEVLTFIEQNADAAERASAQGGTVPALHEDAAPYTLTWWAATGMNDDATFNRCQFDDLTAAETALDCVRRDLANDLIGCNWPARVTAVAVDTADIPF